MTIKILIYSALSLGIVGGTTVGGYFIFKPETSKPETNTKTSGGSPKNPTTGALATQENRGSSSDTSGRVGGQTTVRGTSDGTDASRASGSQPLSQSVGAVQNPTTERGDGETGTSGLSAR